MYLTQPHNNARYPLASPSQRPTPASTADAASWHSLPQEVFDGIVDTSIQTGVDLRALSQVSRSLRPAVLGAAWVCVRRAIKMPMPPAMSSEAWYGLRQAAALLRTAAHNTIVPSNRTRLWRDPSEGPSATVSIEVIDPVIARLLRPYDDAARTPTLLESYHLYVLQGHVGRLGPEGISASLQPWLDLEAALGNEASAQSVAMQFRGAYGFGERTLLLNHHNLCSVPPEVRYFSTVTALHIDVNLLQSLPAALFEMHALETLNMSYNQLTYVSDDIAKFANLRILNISHNLLRTLPKTLSRLQHLVDLNISANPFEHIPDDCFAFTQLIYLDANRAFLPAFAEQLGLLHNLESLELEDNGLDSFPEVLTRLPKLTSLSLANNDLTAINICLASMQSLNSLNLDNNAFEAMPESLADIPNLAALSMRNNGMRQLAANIGNLSRLLKLDIGINHINVLPASFERLKQLCELHLHDNAFEEVPPVTEELRNLKLLNLAHNPLIVATEHSHEGVAMYQYLNALMQMFGDA